ncbi:Transmembrane 4 L6 family member 5 [Camelus dromedarius]|uniref:Transmembrane 4 L6 family member 5 n=1 Tax=Camelus dromedarius TaxID=9838 RepID=A0A5N4D4Q0_CAMDR|nr:Transmembrane 4 L6 family member 5 [Camelus dromedarius]
MVAFTSCSPHSKISRHEAATSSEKRVTFQYCVRELLPSAQGAKGCCGAGCCGNRCRWSLCVQPPGIVYWNVTLFSLLVAASCLEILLCGLQLVNATIGVFCGDCRKKEGAPH